MEFEVTAEDARIAGLAALAIAIDVVEANLPSPLPGVKPGLANVVTLAALHWYGFGVPAWVSVLRVVGGGLLGGTFLSPGFLSLSGAIANLCVLRLATAIPGLSSIGYGALAALAHMVGPFALAYWVLIPHPGLLRLLPVLMTAALVFGFSGGIIARAMVAGMDGRRAQA
ncbi:MAG: Gx transporter family protein [Pseudomonadota bacterium]|nr:Gx transporter family protein [Pseudomonadota bacterium]